MGGLPEDLKFQLVEPLKFLFKDEVRVVGKALGLPDNMVYRQPFPGPGLGVRCAWRAITRDRLGGRSRVRRHTARGVRQGGPDKTVWQYFTVVPPITSTVASRDGKARRRLAGRHPRREHRRRHDRHIPVATPTGPAAKITDRILSDVPTVNRVLYDLSPKPPATIEWE